MKYNVWRQGVNSGAEGKQRKAFTISKDDADWLLRTITAGVDLVKGKLKPYLAAHEHMVSDELLERIPLYTLVVNTEPGWRGTPSVLLQYAHLAIVKYVMSEWFSNIEPTRAAACKKESDDYLAKVSSEANYYDIEPPTFIL